MIYFFADNHYGSNPGRVIYGNLPQEFKNNTAFYEDDWSVLENSPWEEECTLLILNMIGDTCGIPHPAAAAESRVRRYLEKGGNVLLLHGSSAAFWQWDWWRKLPGLRWVRPNDPDGVPPSVHPVKECRIVRCKTKHPLAGKLAELDLPADEIYTQLEYTSPCFPVMETVLEEGSFVQCCETLTPWGGRIVSFIPGHSPEVTSNPLFLNNIKIIIDYLAKGSLI